MSNHHKVAHAWAHQTGRARKGFNVFYEGDTIYSYGYHFPLARLVLTENGPVVLINANGYSVSTAKHKSIVRSAVCHLTSFDVPGVMARTREEHEANRESLLKAARDRTERAKRARVHGDWHLASAQSLLSEANRYAVAFALNVAPVTMDSLGVAIAEMHARLAEAARQREESRQAAEQQRYERQRDQREAWLSGVSNGWRGTDNTGCALGRIVGEDLETSQGVTVPLAHAVKAFRFVKLCRERGTEWRRNGKVIRVGHFHVDHIYADGGFVAGCHKFAWPEVERLATLAGVIDAAPSADAVEVREMVNG